MPDDSGADGRSRAVRRALHHGPCKILPRPPTGTGPFELVGLAPVDRERRDLHDNVAGRGLRFGGMTDRNAAVVNREDRFHECVPFGLLSAHRVRRVRVRLGCVGRRGIDSDPFRGPSPVARPTVSAAR